MRRSIRLVSVTLLLFSAVGVAGCSTSRSTVAGTATAGTPEGQWLVTVRIPSFNAPGRTIEIPILMEMSGGNGQFEGHSPSAVLTDVVGGGRNLLLARLLKPSAVRGGGVIHLRDGRADGNRLTGTLVIPRVAMPTMEATQADGRIAGTLTWRGKPYGTVVGVPHAGAAPLRDYPAVAQAVEATLRSRYYRPADLDSPRWQGFLADVRDRMSLVRDDADALLAFNTLATRVGASHFVLDARGTADALPAPVTAASGPPLVLTTPRPGTALLTAREFPVSLTAEHVRSVFEEIAASDADDLIVDLRGNRGGWFVSLAIASHLLDREVPVGVELGRGWWTRHSALPTAAEAAALPELSAYDLPGFYRTLRDAGAMRATVRPALPHFSGRVVVLTDGQTASAAEPLADVLKATGRATLIGQNTMGAVLTSERLDLPGGWRLQLPTGTYVNAAGVELEGRGVAPDVVVPSAEALDRAFTFLDARPVGG